MKAYYLENEVEILGFEVCFGTYGARCPYPAVKIKRLGCQEDFENQWTQTVLLSDIVIR